MDSHSFPRFGQYPNHFGNNKLLVKCPNKCLQDWTKIPKGVLYAESNAFAAVMRRWACNVPTRHIIIAWLKELPPSLCDIIPTCYVMPTAVDISLPRYVERGVRQL